MSQHPHWFDDQNPSKPGFDPESARRQLRVSVTLVIAMGLAAFVLGFMRPVVSTDDMKQHQPHPDDTFSGRLLPRLSP